MFVGCFFFFFLILLNDRNLQAHFQWKSENVYLVSIIGNIKTIIDFLKGQGCFEKNI